MAAFLRLKSVEKFGAQYLTISLEQGGRARCVSRFSGNFSTLQGCGYTIFSLKYALFLDLKPLQYPLACSLWRVAGVPRACLIGLTTFRGRCFAALSIGIWFV